ncbi:MAG: arginine deiminase family protein [Arachidicoccus sp.]|nr:arginine deiminase family protein [Arachidicoccus sp.]
MWQNEQINVTSEIGELQKLIIHSPDSGIGKVVPAKFKEWLYDDTVYLSQMRKEYNQYIKVLLYFLDEEKIKYILDFEKSQADKQQPDCYKPDKPEYFNSSKVLDIQFLLSRILEEENVRNRIISAVCAWEGSSTKTERKLMQIEKSTDLAVALITGIINDRKNKNSEFLFAPLPNFLFTRDIAITINSHLLLSNAATAARERESLLTKFIAQHFLFKNKEEKLIEIAEPANFFLLSEEEQALEKVSLEGGDVMMIAPNHILIGCSERTTPAGINEVIHNIFADAATGIEKITVIKIPKNRAVMHIDTVFTQVSRNTWVMFGAFSEKNIKAHNAGRYNYYKHFLQNHIDEFKVEILRYQKPFGETYNPAKNYKKNISDSIKGLESLLREISMEDFGVREEDVKIIYSGNNIFPYNVREQWTDACNLLALKEGVVVGYDRNELTIQAFKENGFDVKKAEELFSDFSSKKITPQDIQNTLILLPSSELSRARGGAHCMSLPLLRNKI